MTQDDDGREETRLAIRNAIELGASLLVTWSIALAMRFWLPRHLGPSRFGALSFAEAFAATFFVALSLGIEPYVRKEVAVRPAHASDFFGGTLVLRLGMSAVIVAVMTIAMLLMHSPEEVRRVVYVFALAQIFVTVNATLSAFLQARGSVGAMSVLAVVTKIAWVLGVILAVVTGAGLSFVALAYLVSEAGRAVALFHLARRYLGLVARVDGKATKAVVILCLPHYINTFATTVYCKLDVTLLARAGDDREVGWYAAASALASISLFITPLIGWVLTPTFARAAARSREELFARIRSTTELILIVAIPVGLFVALSADLSVRLLFGEAFAKAAPALRILACTFVLMYVGIVLSITLIMQGRAWTLTRIALAGLVVNLLLNTALVPRSQAWIGEGGGGVGCALAMIGTELCVTSAMLFSVGRGAFDRRTVLVAVKCLAAAVSVAAVDRLFARIGWARLALDAVVYLTIVLTTGAVRPGEIARSAAGALRRRAHAGPAPAREDG